MQPLSTVTVMNLACMSLDLGAACSGTGRMFLGALEVGGARHACSLIHLCASNGNSLEVPSALKPIAEDIQQVANVSSNFLGQSVKQTASGLGNMITGTSDIAARAAGLIPFFGGYFENMIGGTGSWILRKFERALGSGIGNMLDGSVSSQVTRRWKRSALLSPEQEAKQYLDKFDIHLQPDASEIAKGFQSLAEEIKQKTLKAVREKDEKERRDRPFWVFGTGYFGSLSEALGSGIGNMLDGSVSSQVTRRWKRSALLSPEQEAKQYLDKFDIHLQPDASEIAKGFQSLAEEIKQKTLKAVREKDEKERRDRPL
ncbi:hypothetical protein OSTOST_03359 [Ostertagia ostertagi]